MTAKLGPRAARLDGRVVGATGPVLAVAVSAVERRNGLLEFWNGETVELPNAAIASLQQERFSARRTGLLAAGTLGALYVLFFGVGGWDGVGGGGNSKPPPTGQ